MSDNGLEGQYASIHELIKKREGIPNVARCVSFSEISKEDYNLNLQRFINPVYFSESHKRSNSEEILNLSDISQVIRPKREAVTIDYPFVNMAKLANEPSNYVLKTEILPKKKSYSRSRPLLKEDALLIGTVGGVLKPTLFHYDKTPIYLGTNVIALRINQEKLDFEYLISELNSDFIRNQVKKLPMGTTIPHIKKSDILSIAIRVPKKNEQSKIFNEWITSIAEEKIGSLNIEKEKLFAEEFDLIHDLHHTLKNELTILRGAFKSINRYLIEKEKSGERVNLNEPIRKMRKGADPNLHDTVSDKIKSTEDSIEHLSKFVTDYKTILKFDPKNQKREWIQLRDFIKNIFSEYKGFKYDVEEEIFNINPKSRADNYQIFADVSILRLVLTNIIENALEHGFKDEKKEHIIKAVIRDFSDEDNFVKITDQAGKFIDTVNIGDEYVELIIKNNGRPIKENLNADDYFSKGKSYSKKAGKGLGGYHIKKGIKSMGGKVNLLDLENDESFNFGLSIKFPINIAKSPNWTLAFTL